jgi:hypothetical protein
LKSAGLGEVVGRTTSNCYGPVLMVAVRFDT